MDLSLVVNHPARAPCAALKGLILEQGNVINQEGQPLASNILAEDFAPPLVNTLIRWPLAVCMMHTSILGAFVTGHTL
jgi:hypothetical protein